MEKENKKVAFIKRHKSKIIGLGMTAVGVGLIGYGFYQKGAKDACMITGAMLSIYDKTKDVTFGNDFIHWVKDNPDLIVKTLKGKA